MPPMDGESPLLDHDYLEDMRQWIGDATLLTLLATAPDSFRSEQDAIRAAWHAGQVDNVRENAHRLKGAAGSVGCRRLAALAQALQKVAAEDLAALDLLQELEMEVAAAIAAATQWRPQEKADPA